MNTRDLIDQFKDAVRWCMWFSMDGAWHRKVLETPLRRPIFLYFTNYAGKVPTQLWTHGLHVGLPGKKDLGVRKWAT